MIVRRIVPVKSLVAPSKLPGTDFVINPYIGCPHQCVYCYAEFMKRFTNHTEDWGDFLDIKRAEKPIDIRKLAGKRIVISSVTDPYNAFEKRYQVTRHILEQLQNAHAAITIITKSDLILRDIDLIGRLENAKVAISLNSLDDTFRRRFEPRAPDASRRLSALRRLHEAGIRTILFMSPIFPGITRFADILDASQAFTGEYWFENLNLDNMARNRVARAIGQYYPELVPLYRTLYREGDRTWWKRLARDIETHCRQHGMAFRNLFHN
ncbi:radical SAM protein [Oxalobacter aliiformigenes]|uniref:Radical SAM protein n=1 Tax=Oxalobacter aliiformigenes TaxID=2946593 RepID=A0A9E9LF18_9BURK|nr:radical SAM protein [Oxalobacter aliiformigenes]WAV92033.1 radical SAM protein [Oxalobacter aliiformigenes]